MAISGSQQAYTWARSGLARSGATRSNYVLPWTGVDLIVRDGAGNITSRTDLTLYIRADSLHVTQALNDEPDTCHFQIVPTAPASAVPQVGQEIQVSWTPGDVLFEGYALVVQFDRREMNKSPWVSVQCQDSMWRFDARIVTYRFPAQSVTTSIAWLIKYFCNQDLDIVRANDFTTAFVQPDMPALPAVDVVNQRPSTVMRRLLAAVQGGFYIDGIHVHAWAGSTSEPAQTNPTPLTNDLATLKSFRVTHDATQVRKYVIVEGRRTSTLIGVPAMTQTQGIALGLPVGDATLFAPAMGPTARYEARLGSQWVTVGDPIPVMLDGVNPPQTRLAAPFVVGTGTLQLEAMPMAPPASGWIRISGQYAAYGGFTGTPATGPWTLFLKGPGYPYGVLSVPMPAGETVYWVDAVMRFEPRAYQSVPTGDAFYQIRSAPPDTPVVTLAKAQQDPLFPGWPPLEGFVQDGRYSYTGALDRAHDDLAAFAEPLVSAGWDTDDTNARPGRVQAINLTGSSVIDPVTMTVTILSVDLTFPLRTLPPRRSCQGGPVKPSTFLDLVLTDES